MINEKNHKKLSKFMSLVLRHKPEAIDLQLDAQGWTPVKQLIQKMSAAGKKIDLETLQAIVANSDKQRFALSEDGQKIRANQGHSIQVDLGLREEQPPEILYHGTGQKYVDSIWRSGLQKRNRHHVHLSADIPTALNVGQRHGKPYIFEVLAAEMHQAGHPFFLSENGVWLTDAVPVEFLRQKA